MAAASSAEREMNLSALQQRDPYITGIADSASQVAVYSFNSNLNEWVRPVLSGGCVYLSLCSILCLSLAVLALYTCNVYMVHILLFYTV